MTELQQKQLALLNDTCQFFNSNNRCTIRDGLQCVYVNENEEGCAIGRLIEDKKLCKKLDLGFEGKFGVSELRIFDLLPPDLKEYGQDFLSRLQSLHDRRQNWTPTGLSELGERRVNLVKEIFGLN
jgi:hypothetical protein